MKEFKYVIKDELGIHARPAGLLVQKAKEFESDIKISVNEKSASARSIIGIMSLGVKCGSEITVTASGPDENDAAMAIESFLKENL